MIASLVSKFLFDLVQARFSGRVYPDFAPKDTPDPCMIYQVIGSEFVEVMEPNRGDDELTIQLRIYTDQGSGGRSAANSYRDDIREELNAVIRETLDVENGITLEGSMVDSFEDTYDDKTGDYGALCLWHPTIVKRA